MKNYQKQLLKKMHYEEINSNNESLKNVRESLGKIAIIKGNPLTKTEITLNTRIQFVNSLNQPVTFAALPADLQEGSLAVFLFGLTDYYSSFAKSRILKPLNGLWRFRGGIDTAIAGINIQSVVFPYISENGDLVLSFSAFSNIAADDFFAFVTVHCENVAYGTFLNSFASDLITINTLRLIVPIATVNQYINSLTFGYQTLFGKTFSDDIDPRNYITNTDFQQQICDIPVNLPIDKAVMLLTNLNISCTNMSIILFVEKVEPLTHK